MESLKTRKITSVWIVIVLALFIVAIILGILMRLNQGTIIQQSPVTFYGNMTTHGLTMIGIWFVAIVCWCDALKPIDSRTRVVFIQHPRESRVPISTCRMAHRSLPNSELHIGLGAVGDASILSFLSRTRRRMAGVECQPYVSDTEEIYIITGICMATF